MRFDAGLYIGADRELYGSVSTKHRPPWCVVAAVAAAVHSSRRPFLQPKEIRDIKKFIDIATRKDAKGARAVYRCERC